MKLTIFLLILMLLLTSCGALKLSPQGCKSSGQWGTVDENENNSVKERKFSSEYYVLTLDKEIRLRDFLKEKGVSCKDIKTMRVEMSSVFFVKRILNVYITE